MRNNEASELSSMFMKAMVVVILGAAVAIPVILDVIEGANVSGTTETVLTLVPLFVALLLLIALAKPMMERFGRA